MAFIDKRLAEVCDIGENVFRNFTDDHMFIVGDKISYQIGDYDKEQYKYRIQGFVLAHGISVKGELMYLLSQMNTVIYDSENDSYGSDKRVTARWYTAREIHAEEGNKYCPKVIGRRTNQTVVRVTENHGIHFINTVESTRETKTTKIHTVPKFNKSVTELPWFKCAYYNEAKEIKWYSAVCAYVAPNQMAAKTAFESGDTDYVEVSTIPERWNEKKGKYIQRKTASVYYVIVDLTKKE